MSSRQDLQLLHIFLNKEVGKILAVPSMKICCLGSNTKKAIASLTILSYRVHPIQLNLVIQIFVTSKRNPV